MPVLFKTNITAAFNRIVVWGSFVFFEGYCEEFSRPETKRFLSQATLSYGELQHKLVCNYLNAVIPFCK